MRCPFCQHEYTRVVDSRISDSGSSVRRRRECQQCRERFTTFEHAELVLPHVVKSDGRREPFNEVKIRGGISRALEKRPIDGEAIETAINRIQHRLMTMGEREVPAKLIGEVVMAELFKLDEVAYVRFASVYRRFQDLDAFSEEVKRIRNQFSTGSRKNQLSFLPDEGKKS